jgi:hypothetical protein
LQTTSDSSGHFKFDAVPAGNYEFEVVAQGFKRTTRPNMSVTDQMQPVTPEKPMELTVVMEVGPTGSPIVEAIIPETVVAPAGSCGPSDSVTYGPRQTGDGDALGGIVIAQYPKIPVTRATLQLFDATGVHIAEQQTNERGEFQFKQTAPGRYHILFQHPGYEKRESVEFWVARENKTYLTLQALQPGKFVICQ